MTEKSMYFKSVEFLVNLAKKANDEGDYFPVWGTSLGFEALVEL
jgi:gamma-glutamyl hydrolase